jgi:hypothetical protein
MVRFAFLTPVVMKVPSSEIWHRPGWYVGTNVLKDMAAYTFKYSLSLFSFISNILPGQRELHVRGERSGNVAPFYCQDMRGKTKPLCYVRHQSETKICVFRVVGASGPLVLTQFTEKSRICSLVC